MHESRGSPSVAAASDPRDGIGPAVAVFPVASAQARSWFTPPGGLLVWMIVFLEVLTFGIGLVIFLRLRAAEPGVFRLGRAELSQTAALINTIALLSGGWAMANALARLRAGRIGEARRGLLGAVAWGGGFLLFKGWEYRTKLAAGLDLHHDTFHTMYWLLTGFHYAHVVVAVILLAGMAWGLRGGTCSAEQAENVESSGVFWHLCDLIWLLLVPALYLLP